MKDKEKQIEEMEELEELVFFLYENKDYTVTQFAEELYEKGYRKLPEDSVVLSREEYKMLLEEARKAKNQCIKIELETIMKAEEKASKETAEKIYRMADEICIGSQNDGDKILAMIKEQFGVEIKE